MYVEPLAYSTKSRLGNDNLITPCGEEELFAIIAI